jgi:predicted transcriptional regulator
MGKLKKPALIKKAQIHYTWRKKTKEELAKQGLFKKTPIGFVLTKKGKQELAFAKLFFEEEVKNAQKDLIAEAKTKFKNPALEKKLQEIRETGPLEALRVREGSREGTSSKVLGSTDFGILCFWLREDHERLHSEFKKAHPNPKKEMKKLGL